MKYVEQLSGGIPETATDVWCVAIAIKASAFVRVRVDIFDETLSPLDECLFHPVLVCGCNARESILPYCSHCHLNLGGSHLRHLDFLKLFDGGQDYAIEFINAVSQSSSSGRVRLP